MKKYKKIIIGLILGLICAILPFVGVAKAKALTVEEITTLNNLSGTSWLFNNNVELNSLFSSNNNSVVRLCGTQPNLKIASFQYGNNSIDITTKSNSNYVAITFNPLSNGQIYIISNGQQIDIFADNNFISPYNQTPIILNFEDNIELKLYASLSQYSDSTFFLNWLKNNATLYENTEPTSRTIPFRISLITNVFGEQLEYISSSIINLPVFDDTVSFTVSFENNKMINGQIEHPESADELGELTFSNGERVFYTIYYNETNIEFKLYFYGEQLFLYEAVMYNTEVLDSGGNYQATVATYSEGISEQEMQTLKNSGIYEASFDITIPQEEELVTDAQLMLEIGILEGSEPPGFDNITNIMTGIFTLVSSFLSIQLGFITLGQIIGLILAIGVIFFIFYVWNGGRNGN